ncbi:hypothetical protein HPB48_009319 [Haemaphysalis longicornis]|uniref:Uncharacterized protein n=1 Tax=Haemaphysalis longicornis TaxID=44386 RepID=A0A9J6G9W6_HAELO|nr:hypothetical protein HPB48_009319 [Haemaphysalis longicornis]
MLRRAGLTDVSYWMGYFFEMGFVIGCAILLMYVPLFMYPNSSGTAFLQYVDAGLFITLLAVFGVLTIMHAMLLSIFFWECKWSFKWLFF